MHRQRQPRGFTLIEVVFSTAIVGLVFSMILGTFSLSDDAINEGVIQTELDMKASAIVERIANDLKDAVGTVVVGGTTTFPAFDGVSFQKGDGGPFNAALPGFPAGTTITYSCFEVTRNGQVFNCLQRQVTPVGGATTTEILSDELSGDAANGVAALGDDPLVGGVHKVRIPINPPPTAPVPTAQQVSRAVYIAATAYGANNAGNVLNYVDVGVTLARINYRRQRSAPNDPSSYTQLGFAHTQVKLNNNCSISTNSTGLSTTEGF